MRPDASFASLGLDSMELVTLTDALREFLDQPTLSAALALDHPTVDALSAHLAELRPPEVEPVRPPPLVRTGAQPVVSFFQEALLAWEAQREPSSTWTETTRVRLQGPLDRARLTDAIRRVVERQEGLRQLFVRGQGPMGTASVFDIPVHAVDVEGEPDHVVEQTYRTLAETPLDLDGTPLLHAHLLIRGAHDHHLVLRWHQLVHGGTDGAMLLEEILESYAALVEGRAPVLPELPVSFADHAAWERSYFDGVGRTELAAAQQRLEGARPLPLPFDHVRSGAPSVTPVGGSFGLDPAASARFVEMCKAEDVTLFVGVATLMGVMLARWCGVEETMVMTPTSTRNRAEIRALAGKFGAWTPIRMSIAGDPTVRELLAQVRAQAAFASSPVPGPLLYDTSDVFGHPLNRVIVNVPSHVGPPTTLPPEAAGVTVTPEPVYKPLTTRADLALVATQMRGRVVGRLTAGDDQFDEDTIQARIGDLVRLLRTVRPDIRVSEIGQRRPRTRAGVSRDDAPTCRAARLVATEEAFTTKEHADALRALGQTDIDDLDVDVMRFFTSSHHHAREVMGQLLDLDEERLGSMDDAAIDVAVLSLVSPGVQVFDRDTAVGLAASTNDELAEAVRQHPERLAGLASFAPQDPVAAVREIERAITKLGLHGLVVNSHTEGLYLDDPRFWPILEAAAALDAPIYIHPRNPPTAFRQAFTSSAPAVGAHPAVTGVGGRHKLTEVMWGFHAETSLHAARLIVSGVFDRFPNLKIVLGHLGEGLPFLLFRMDWAARLGYALQRKPSEYFQDHFWVTTSGLFESPVAQHALQHCHASLGADRILFAADHPFAQAPEVTRALSAAALPDADLEKIAWRNAVELFRLKGVERP